MRQNNLYQTAESASSETHKENKMGVDTKIKLPSNVRVKDVANVIGALAGCPVQKRYFQNDPKEGWSAHVDNVEIETTCVPSMVQIVISRPMVDGEKNHFVFFHFEDENDDVRGLNPPSSPFWLAIAHGLVDFFGGSIDYQDWDSSYTDYKVQHKPKKQNSPSNGEDWYDLQNRILNIKPITKSDLIKYNEIAAYKN